MDLKNLILTRIDDDHETTFKWLDLFSWAVIAFAVIYFGIVCFNTVMVTP